MTIPFRQLLTLLIFTLSILFIAWVGLFNVNSVDFWWNVKAGQIMLESGWIHTDPFAYPREGAPYMATQLWLGQIILALVFGAWSFQGVIALRIFVLALTLVFLLMIDKKRIWPNAFLVMLAAISMRGWLLDRPLIWTFLFLSIELFLILKILDLFDTSAKLRTKNLLTHLALFTIAHITWLNLHGGAAFLSSVLLSSVLLQQLVELPKNSRNIKSILRDKKIQILIASIFIIFLASFASPNLHKNFVYFFKLQADKSTRMIAEWQATELTNYLKRAAFFWLTASVSFAFVLRKSFACGFMFLVFGLMSALASRHVPLFVIVATGLTFYQLKHNPDWHKILDKLFNKKLLIIGISIIAFSIILIVNEPVRSMFAKDDFDSIGVNEPLKNLYQFIEDNEPHGNMYNSYSEGSYLLYRGYPDRKVFLDGRNVDHGYEFIKRSMDARRDKDAWEEIEEMFNPTYAIVKYRPPNEKYGFRYSHLNENLNWALVFIDHSFAVFYKRIPEHTETIRKHEYKIINTKEYGERTLFENLEQSQARALTDELLRQIESDPDGITSHLLLAQIFIASEIYDNALMVLKEATQREPNHFETYELMAAAYDKLGETELADEMYRKAKKLVD